MNVYEEKRRKTREAIQRSFLQLLEQKPFDAITIGDIAKKARINRGTFYLHFVDKFDLLECMEQQLFAEMGEHIDQLQSRYLANRTIETELKQLAETLFQFIHDHAPTIKVWLSDHGKAGFHLRFRNAFSAKVRSNLERHDDFHQKLTVPMDYFLSFITSAFLGMIEQWIQNDLDQTPEEMTALYIEMITFIQTGGRLHPEPLPRSAWNSGLLRGEHGRPKK